MRNNHGRRRRKEKRNTITYYRQQKGQLKSKYYSSIQSRTNKIKIKGKDEQHVINRTTDDSKTSGNGLTPSSNRMNHLQ